MKNFLSIILFLLSVSAFAQQQQITFADKDKTLPTSDPRRLIREEDVNEIKSVVNANATDVTTQLALRALLSSFVENEVPSGSVNSSNVTFTLANTPVAGSVRLYQNGLLLKGGGVDYSISGATITFVSAPITGDYILSNYRK